MYNFNGSKRKKRVIAIVSLVLIAAMIITTFVSSLIF
jgi:hypothetical protein